eukprot:5863643-Ditylum_brightwellii.AAC.1
MTRSSGCSLHSTTPKSSSAKRQFSHQGNTITKRVKLSGTPSQIIALPDKAFLSINSNTGHNKNSSPTSQQSNQDEPGIQENNNNNPQPNNRNDPDQENNNHKPPTNTSTKQITMPNNSNNNTNTDNTSIHSIGSQNDEQDHPGNEEDAGDKEEVNPNSSPTPQNDKRPDT